MFYPASPDPLRGAAAPAASDSQPQLNDIALFVEVAKRNNISRAAETTGVPATTVSRRLRQLESALGVSLMVRTTRRITLTEAGRLYFERCRELVDQVRDAHSVLQSMGVRPSGTLKVLLPEPLDALGFTRLAREFAERWPELEFRFDYAYQAELDPSCEFDVALRWGRQADSDLIARRLADIPHRLHASPRYLRARGQPGSPDELGQHECLRPDLCSEMKAWILERDGRQVSVPVSGKFASNNLELLRKLAASGAGIVALPSIGPQHPGMVPVLQDWQLAPIPLFAVFPTRKPPARTRAFLDFLQRRIGELLQAQHAPPVGA